MGGHADQAAVDEAQPPVELVLEHAFRAGALRPALFVDGLAAGARARRVARLRHEVLDHAVEDAAVVVPLHAQLHEVAARQRRLLAPQLDVQRADRGVQHHLALGRRLVGVDRQVGHGRREGARRREARPRRATGSVAATRPRRRALGRQTRGVAGAEGLAPVSRS